MKDITRIHIAKVPYSIELSAKKNLETYISSLELYMSDKEVLADIEIRITELLLERGVKQDAVISDADVSAIREQLGEPKEFSSEDDGETIDPEILSATSPRRLYRNPDSALLGGVLGGIASYLRINVIWVRLIAIALSFVSFGLFVLLYIVLWLVIPSARTAAEKLQMAGRPVTLTSIRELNESGLGVDSEKHIQTLKRVATIIIGVGGIILAGMSATVLGIALFGLLYHNPSMEFWSAAHYQSPIILGFGAGALLTILFLLIAFAAFTQKFNKRIWISGIVIIVLGLGLFGTSVISAGYESRQLQEEIQRNTIQTSLTVPAGFTSATSLAVDVPTGTSVVYVVDNSQSSMTQRMVKGTDKADITVKDGTIKIHLAPQTSKELVGESTISVYGPQLEKIMTTNGYTSYNSGSQEHLAVEIYNDSSLRLIGSRIDTLSVKTDERGQLSADEAAIASVQASIYGQSSIDLGNIKSLNVTNPDVCASDQTAQLRVKNSIASTYTHNGIEQSTKTSQGPCLNINFESDDDGMHGFRDPRLYR